jgi:L-aminopeptidase/D-esterase-like protein
VSGLGVAGLRAGHWTGARTGTTVLLFPAGSVGSGEVRGGAPATRETALLDPLCTVARVDAVVLTGGSAYGLAAADGVMRFLAERGQGFPTAAGVVPIVPTAAIFDLVHAGDERPGAEEGYAAAVAAERGEPLATGAVGAGRGATVGKWRGRAYHAPAGLGAATATVDGFTVAAVAAVNAVGDVIAANGTMLAGSSAPGDVPAFPPPDVFAERDNTTLAVVVTDAPLDKPACHLVARSGHDGFARALRPVHTRVDGDVCFAVATGGADGAPVHLDRLREAAADVTAAAIRDAVAAEPSPTTRQ